MNLNIDREWLRRMADAENEAMKGTCGPLACSPEFYGLLKPLPTNQSNSHAATTEPLTVEGVRATMDNLAAMMAETKAFEQALGEQLGKLDEMLEVWLRDETRVLAWGGPQETPSIQPNAVLDGAIAFLKERYPQAAHRIVENPYIPAGTLMLLPPWPSKAEMAGLQRPEDAPPIPRPFPGRVTT